MIQKLKEKGTESKFEKREHDYLLMSIFILNNVGGYN